MSETNDAQSPRAAPATIRRWPVARHLCMLLSIACGAALTRLLILRTPDPQWNTQVLLLTAAFATSLWVAVKQWAHWQRPTDQACQLIRQIRDGEMPVAELSMVRGGIEPMIPLLQELMHDLKQHRAERSKLENEMRQRVANRTLALERLIGSRRQQATRDSLTGLYNRRQLDNHLPELVERCLADQTTLSLLMIDVDHFKQVNDTLGHMVGDKLLGDVGDVIRSSLREQDLAFRYGGDEFVVLLPGQNKAQADVLAKRLSSLVDAMGKTLRLTPSPRLSIGIAMLQDLPQPSAETLLASADRLLYEMKTTRKQAAA